MSVTIRPFRPDDAQAFLEVHHAAVRGTAAGDYPASVIDAWAPAILESHVERVKADRTSIRILALHHDEIVGIGEIVPDKGELRACYVSPLHGGQGIGRAIVGELEVIARSKGALSLWLDSSLTAEAFYESLGYVVLERGEHVLGTGVRMACVRMCKEL